MCDSNSLFLRILILNQDINPNLFCRPIKGYGKRNRQVYIALDIFYIGPDQRESVNSFHFDDFRD